MRNGLKFIEILTDLFKEVELLEQFNDYFKIRINR
jgi:hypothetical protein